MPCACIARGVLLVVADREQPAVHLRMQRLHAAVHHLREAGDLRHVGHLEPGVGQRLAGAAGGDELDAVLGERAGEIERPALSETEIRARVMGRIFSVMARS